MNSTTNLIPNSTKEGSQHQKLNYMLNQTIPRTEIALMKRPSEESGSVSTEKQRQQPLVLFDYDVHELLNVEGGVSFDELPPFDDVGRVGDESSGYSTNLNVGNPKSNASGQTEWALHKKGSKKEGRLVSPNYSVLNLIIR